ncbi:PREDICTED: uncharacterized protein LOC109212030 [Nicotiana attenuata]|uniref:uncharacterized protein LOC109212030 n=1 Tax=Nicotiana attenuata TaxID=49451 RepID=UPI0009053079|nr:PREDICTED: uncharacterized protein LOC109212030 [Nicotiana attenuata]
MVDKFVIAHAGAKKAEARMNDIFAIKQSLGEGLKDFLSRFNRVRKTLLNVTEGMAVAVFQNGLSRSGSRATKNILSRIMKYRPTTWDKIHNAYRAEVRADEDDFNGPTQCLTSVQTESKKDQRNDNRRDLAGPRPNQERHQPYIKGTLMPPPRHEEGPSRPRIGTHRNEREIVYALEKLGLKTRGREHASPKAPKRVDERSREDQLRPRARRTSWAAQTIFPVWTIQMIIGGGDDASINSVKFTTTHKLKRSITHERHDELEESIIFDKSDTHGLVFPHYDALVITLCVFDTDIRRIMVDDGSGACIIHPRVLTQMKLEDRVVLRCITLTGFNNDIEQTSGEITLPILDGGVTLETTFHIMDQDTAYNAIIGRPWIHAMKVVPSSLYEVIKFPTPWEIFCIRGEQRTARECYCIAQDCTYTQQLKGKAEEA